MRPAEVILVHSPFVGPSSWGALAAALRGLGHAVAEPVRASAWDVEAPYYPQLARRIASATETGSQTPLLLMAHSAAGGLVPSLAEAIGPRVQAAIFIDAVLPHSGQDWFQTAPPGLAASLRSRIADGRLPRWDRWLGAEVLARLLPDKALRDAFVAELAGAPVAYADEPAPACPSWPPGGCGYLQLSDGYGLEAEAASAAAWLVDRDIIHHLATATHPDRVARRLHLMIQALSDSP